MSGSVDALPSSAPVVSVTASTALERGSETASTPDGARSGRSGAGSARRRDVQGLRAVAIVLVVLYHSEVGVRGGFTGVDVFFVISGFVISGMLLRERAATGRTSLRHFYARRARRLLPALAMASTVTLLASAVLLSPLSQTQAVAGAAGVAASTFVANAYFAVSSGGYFQPAAAANPFLHTWSLSVEEQFYILFPALLLLAWRAGRRASRPLLVRVVLAALLASFALGVSFSYGWLPDVKGLRTLAAHPALATQLAFYSPVTRAWEFLAGAALAIVGGGRVVSRRAAYALTAVGVVMLVVSAFVLTADVTFPGVVALVPVLATVALIAAGSSTQPTAVTRLLSSRPAVRVGDLSYGWYLWHWPAIVFAKLWFPGAPWIWLVAAVGALVPAAVLHRWVEEPIHRGRRLVSRRATVTLVVVCVAVPAVCGLALISGTHRFWGRADIAAIEAVVQPEHADLTSGCTSTSPLGTPGGPSCLWSLPNPRGTILLIGDSNAGHLTEPMVAVARTLGMNLQVAVDGGCPFIKRSQYVNPGCEQVVTADLAYIASHRPAYAAIVVSNASASYVNTSSRGRKEELPAWVADSASTVSALAASAPVIAIGSTPQFPDLPGCLVPSVLSTARGASCGHLTPAEATTQRGDLVAAERQALSGLATGYLDTADVLCTAASGCDAYVDGQLAYRDGAHLSVSGSMLLEPALLAQLSRASSSR